METTDLSKVIDKKIQAVSEFAREAFQDHEVVQTLDNGFYRSWKCYKPGTCFYAFTVTTIPGHIIVTGDVGDLIVSRTEDMIGWCKGSIQSIDYFASKVPHSIPTKGYDSEVALEWLEEQAKEEGLSPAELSIVQNLKDCVDDQEELFRGLSCCGMLDGDYPTPENFNSNFLWCREAIKFLLENVD